MSERFFTLDPAYADPKRIKRERDKAKELRKTTWWKSILAKGICHYCSKKFEAAELTMDHVVPLARGGSSQKNNCVPACKPCNQAKRLETPVDRILEELKKDELNKK